MTSKKNSTVGKFYAVSKGAISQVAKHSNRAAVVLTYLTLKRGQQRNNTNVTTWGRPKVAEVLGVSQRHAIKLMDELRSIGWGKSYQETAMVDAKAWNEQCGETELVPPGHPGRGDGSNKVMPPYGDDYIYLPNSLTERSSHKKYSPLGQLYHLKDKDTRLHATMLLLSLYEHLDMQHFGGADPAATIYIPWRYEGESKFIGFEDYPITLGYQGKAGSLHYWAVDFRASDGHHWSEHMTATHWAFIESITGETAAADKHAPKFWEAWRALRDLGLFYHAAMVFDEDPLKDQDAEVLYPLWIFNPAERKRLDTQGNHEGGLAKLAGNKAIRDCVNDDFIEIMDELYANEILLDGPTGLFIAAAHNPQAKVLGILRPRFIPNTTDGQAGWASIRDKAAEWASILRKRL